MARSRMQESKQRTNVHVREVCKATRLVMHFNGQKTTWKREGGR